MSLMVTPHVKYHKLTKVANKIVAPLRQDIEKLWALTFTRHCSQVHDKSKKNCSSTLNCYAYCHTPYSSNDEHLYHSIQHFLTEKLFNDVEEVKRSLLNVRVNVLGSLNFIKHISSKIF